MTEEFSEKEVYDNLQNEITRLLIIKSKLIDTLENIIGDGYECPNCNSVVLAKEVMRKINEI